MPAPKLLDKKLIQASLATERKHEIDKGKKLSEAVLALEEAKVKEERELEEFRVNTLKAIQIEIDAKQTENVRVREENKLLKEERIRLEGPIDLIEAWTEVQGLVEKYDIIADNLLKREIDISSRESDVTETKNSFVIREKEIRRAETAAEENLSHSEIQRNEAEQANVSAQELLSSIEQQAAEQKLFFEERALELDTREEALIAREEQLTHDTIEINKQKLLLADRRATLERGFEELRRKQI